MFLVAHNCGEQRKRRHAGAPYNLPKRVLQPPPTGQFPLFPSAAPSLTLCAAAPAKSRLKNAWAACPYCPVLGFMARCEAMNPPDQAEYEVLRPRRKARSRELGGVGLGGKEGRRKAARCGRERGSYIPPKRRRARAGALPDGGVAVSACRPAVPSFTQ
jgi:hypothetical protein